MLVPDKQLKLWRAGGKSCETPVVTYFGGSKLIGGAKNDNIMSDRLGLSASSSYQTHFRLLFSWGANACFA